MKNLLTFTLLILLLTISCSKGKEIKPSWGDIPEEENPMGEEMAHFSQRVSFMELASLYASRYGSYGRIEDLDSLVALVDSAVKNNTCPLTLQVIRLTVLSKAGRYDSALQYLARIDTATAAHFLGPSYLKASELRLKACKSNHAGDKESQMKYNKMGYEMMRQYLKDNREEVEYLYKNDSLQPASHNNPFIPLAQYLLFHAYVDYDATMEEIDELTEMNPKFANNFRQIPMMVTDSSFSLFVGY